MQSSKFSRLFSLSKKRLTSVRDFCEFWNNPNTEVDMLLSRQLRAWELEDAVKINDIIENLNFSLDNE